MKFAWQKHLIYCYVVSVALAALTSFGIVIPSQLTEWEDMYIEHKPIIVQLRARKTMIIKAAIITLKIFPQIPT